MSFRLTRSFVISPSKFLFSNFLKTQCYQKMLNVDYRNLSYTTVFDKIRKTFMNFRSQFFSKDLKKEKKKVTITFERHDGIKIKKVVPIGTTIHTIFHHDGDEIPKFATCEGSQACATCHVIFPEYLIDKLEKPEDVELDTVEYANGYNPLYSRLGCCVEVIEEMDGAVLFVPEIIGDKRNADLE